MCINVLMSFSKNFLRPYNVKYSKARKQSQLKFLLIDSGVSKGEFYKQKNKVSERIVMPKEKDISPL